MPQRHGVCAILLRGFDSNDDDLGDNQTPSQETDEVLSLRGRKMVPDGVAGISLPPKSGGGGGGNLG